MFLIHAHKYQLQQEINEQQMKIRGDFIKKINQKPRHLPPIPYMKRSSNLHITCCTYQVYLL